MFPNILDQGFVDVTDPARLHAELWGDFFSKVISCWLPLLMSTVLVGRDLLGSSIQCFPLDLVHVPAQPENGTFISHSNSSSNAFSGVSAYSRQLSEFVNTYCAGKNSFPEDTIFSYQFFAMMLVVQAGLMYLPFLIWNLTKGREIICIVRFIAHDMEVVYGRFRKPHNQDQVQTGGQGVVTQGNVQSQAQQQTVPVYGQEELVEAEKQWRADCTMYKWYLIKQGVSFLISFGFLIGFVCQLKSIFNIRDKFPCSVEDKFSVTCTVPAAKVHQFIWVTDMVLLGINMFVILINIVLLYKRAEDYPFAEIGPGAPEKKLKEKEEKSKEQVLEKKSKEKEKKSKEKKSKETKSQGAESHSFEQVDIEVGDSDETQSLTKGENTKEVQGDKDQKEAMKQGLAQSCMECFPHVNDSCLMHAFFKANVESVEKYNYVKNLLKVAPKLNNAQRPQS